MQELQHKHFADSRQGQDLLAEEVALPQAGCVPGHEFIPRRASPLRTGGEPRRFQNIPHRAFLDGADAQLLEFTHDSRITPLVFPRHSQNQLPQLFPQPRTATFRRFRFRFLRPPLFTNPAEKRIGRNDRHQLPNGLAQLRTKSQQPLPFLRRDKNPRRQFLSQRFVLYLEILNLPGQLGLRRPGDHHQQRVEKRHRLPVS